MIADRDNFTTITWRMSGSLAPVFARFSTTAVSRVLRMTGRTLVSDAKDNIRAKGWKKLGNAIISSLNAQQAGTRLEVGATHVAARMREFGGRISAPGQGDLARRRDWLTIPVGEAKGRTYDEMRARGWSFFRIMGKKGFPVLMGYKTGVGKRSKYRAARPLFALRTEVRHPASPWFPTFAQITARFNEAFGTAL